MARGKRDIDTAIIEDCAKYYADPLGFVKWAFPWGEANGPLSQYPEGPDEWQAELLTDIGKRVVAGKFNMKDAIPALRYSVSSGHGAGKSCLVAWLVCWIMSTRPFSQGTVTANTFTQLETKTWAQIQRWMKMCITAHWFTVGATKITAKDSPERWFVSSQTCREENSEAFAGQHAADSTSFYIMDEGSAVPDAIYEVAEGGLTDGEPMIFIFGNPTRNTGKFYRTVFGSERDRWDHRCIDSRKCKFTNKAQIAEWEQDYGEDSDFFRVRVRGLAPAASDLQFIDSERVYDAQKRKPSYLSDDPLVVGVDVARGGGDFNVIAFRRGFDARSIPWLRIPGEQTRDSTLLTTKLAELLNDKRPDYRIEMMFIDSALGGPIVNRLHQLGFRNVTEINFGMASPDPHQANMRAYMWNRMKQWLINGAIPSDSTLETDLTGPGFRHNAREQLVLESKEQMARRGLASTDAGDALCFVAGTLVRTPKGQVPIEQIATGDVVTTPFGPSTVAVVHCSDTSALTTARFSNGSALTGKGDHELFSYSKGKVRLGDLSLTDEVEPFSKWRVALWQAAKLFTIRANATGFKHLAGTFKPARPINRRDFCTAGFGLTIADLYRTATRFITSITTGATTPLRTLNYASSLNTPATICWTAPPTQRQSANGLSTWLSDETKRPSGTVLQKGLSGTSSMASEPGMGESLSRWSAQGAGRNTKHFFLADRTTAPRRARWLSPSSGTSRTLASALSAARTLLQTVTGRRPVVPISVQTENVPPTRVYNLTLTRHNAYYANDILAFNCLTLAQDVMSLSVQTMARRTAQMSRQEYSWMA